MSTNEFKLPLPKEVNSFTAFVNHFTKQQKVYPNMTRADYENAIRNFITYANAEQLKRR